MCWLVYNFSIENSSKFFASTFPDNEIFSCSNPIQYNYDIKWDLNEKKKIQYHAVSSMALWAWQHFPFRWIFPLPERKRLKSNNFQFWLCIWMLLLLMMHTPHTLFNIFLYLSLNQLFKKNSAHFLPAEYPRYIIHVESVKESFCSWGRENEKEPK